MSALLSREVEQARRRDRDSLGAASPAEELSVRTRVEKGGASIELEKDAFRPTFSLRRERHRKRIHDVGCDMNQCGGQINLKFTAAYG